VVEERGNGWRGFVGQFKSASFAQSESYVGLEGSPTLWLLKSFEIKACSGATVVEEPGNGWTGSVGQCKSSLRGGVRGITGIKRRLLLD